MRWPWTRDPCPSDDATASATEASRALRDAKNLAYRVDEVASQLWETKQRNHFAAAVARAIRGA